MSERLEKAFREYLEEMRSISQLHVECVRREVEALQVLALEINGDNPKDVHAT